MVPELKLGIMTNKELAEWSNVTEAYLSKHKKSWCEKKLSKYADYNNIRGGVEILKIKEPIYNCEGAKAQVKKNLRECWGRPNYRVDTCRNAANKIKKRIRPANLIADSTLYTYTCDAKRELWGVAKRYAGSEGTSYWVMCKIVNGEAAPFTEDELELCKELKAKYLKTDADRIIDLKAAKAAYDRGEIQKEDFGSIIDDIMNYELGWMAFEEAFTEAIGAPIDFQTLVEEDIIKILSNPLPGDFTF